jgi:hypothetical protein
MKNNTSSYWGTRMLGNLQLWMNMHQLFRGSPGNIYVYWFLNSWSQMLNVFWSSSLPTAPHMRWFSHVTFVFVGIDCCHPSAYTSSLRAGRSILIRWCEDFWSRWLRLQVRHVVLCVQRYLCARVGACALGFCFVDVAGKVQPWF